MLSKKSNWMLATLILYLPFHLFSQTPPSFTLSVNPTPSTCLQNGMLDFVVANTDATATMTYEVDLLGNVTNPDFVTNMTTLGGLLPGTYNVMAIQSMPDGQFNTQLVSNVVITNLYTPILFTFSTTPESCGFDGTITVNVTSGDIATIEIISGPSGPIVLPPGSNVFTGLEEGVYIISVTNICGDIVNEPEIVSFSTPYLLFNNSPRLSARLAACDMINVLTDISNITPSVGRVVHPITITVDVTTPFGGSLSFQNTYNSGLAFTQTIPFYCDESYMYQVTAQDGCGSTITSPLLTIDGALHLNLNLLNASCGNRNLQIAPRNYTNYTIDFIQSPAGFDPTLHPFFPGSFSGNTVFNMIPEGVYEVEITDDCGKTATETIEFVMGALGVFDITGATETLEGCDAGFGSVSFRHPNSSIITAEIISAPATYTDPLPSDVSAHIRAGANENAGFFMGDLPEGDYIFRFYDACGRTVDKSVTIPGFDGIEVIPSIDVVYAGCDLYFFHINVPEFNIKINIEVFDDITGTWVLIGNTFSNAGTLIFGPYTGDKTYRILTNRRQLGSNGSLVSDCPRTEHAVLPITNELSFDGAFGFNCNNGFYDVLLLASNLNTSAIITYCITEKDGSPLLLNNGTDPVFVGLSPGLYNFQAKDDCGNILNRMLEVTSLEPPVIRPENLCDGENGSLNIEGLDFLDFEWWEASAPGTILSTMSTLDFIPFDAATDPGTYFVNISYSAPNSCIDETLSFVIPEIQSDANAGNDSIIVLCNIGEVLNLFDYLGPTYDGYGTWSDLSNSGGLFNNQFFTANISPGTYSFEYTLNGLCTGEDASIIQIILEASVINCMATTSNILLDANGMGSITTADVDNSSSSSCGPVTLFVTPSTFDCSQLGNQTVYLVVTDMSGDSVTCATTVTVIDDIAPTCDFNEVTVFLDKSGEACLTTNDIDTTLCIPIPVCVQGLSIDLVPIDIDGDGENDSAQAEIFAEQFDASSFSPCGFDLTYSFSQDVTDDSFILSCDNLGDFELELWVTDSFGAVNYCETYIEVTDSQSFCPAGKPLNRLKRKNKNGFNRMMSSNITDNCGIQFITLSQDKFTCEDVGEDNMIIASVFDFSNNVTECMLIVNVQDTCAPVCQLGMTEIDLPSGACGGIVEFELPEAIDNCNIPTSTNVGPLQSGDEFPIGTTTVYYLVDDGVGNEDTCEYLVIVNEFDIGSLSCKDINLSLDETCQTAIIPSMVLTGNQFPCLDSCTIEITDPWGNLIPNHFTGENVGQNYTYNICCNDNCCWGNVLVEYKLPPEIECPENIIVQCSELGIIDEYVPITTFCGTGSLVLINESITNTDCEIGDFIKSITRTYKAVDSYGNESDPCSFDIFVEGLDFTKVIYPEDKIILNETAIACNEDYPLDENGFPSPFDNDGMLGAGEPLYELTNGTFVSFYNESLLNLCNVYINYTDTEFAGNICIKKIMRRWEIREWICGQENIYTHNQIMEIADLDGPDFICPPDMTVTTNYECKAIVYLPSITVEDDCNEADHYFISGTMGSMYTNGGIMEMEIGNYDILYEIFDACYSKSQCIVNVEVHDQTPPIALCEQHTIVSLSSSPISTMYASTFDDGSYDDCYLDSIKVRRMVEGCLGYPDTTFTDKLHFCCEDVQLGDIMVQLRVWDHYGNYNDCMVGVKVQDKIAPELTCLDDVTIECDALIDIDQLGLQFGYVHVEDNCMEGIDLLEIVEDNRSQCGIGTIIRTTTLAGNEFNSDESCYQTITVINQNPFTYEDIEWPKDTTLYNLCDTSQLQPIHFAPPYDKPIFLENVCDLVGYNWKDEVFTFVPGEEACLKIIRTWSVIDWCQFDENGESLIWEYQQIIKLENTEAPIITSDCSDLRIESNDVNCGPAYVSLVLLAQDENDCTPAEQLAYEYIITLEDGSLIHGETSIASDTFPLGIHHIKWTVLDLCGNFDVCDYHFEVVNTKAPLPKCVALVTSLIPMDLVINDSLLNEGAENLDALDSLPDGLIDNEMVEIWASDFNFQSEFACGSDSLTFSFSEDTMNQFRIFGCEDSGLNFIEMWVTDQNGNQAFCETTLTVLDTNGVDICNSDLLMVRGNIETEDGLMVEDVQISLMGSNKMEYTDIEGGYVFGDIIENADYEVIPSLNKDPLNGVSTIDMVYIQRHLLGIEDLGSVYDIIAADANNSASVSAADLTEIKKLILGVTSSFQHSESWRFVDKNQTFINDLNPWNEGINESYSIDNISSNMDIDFYGIKIGDIDGSVEMNGSTKAINRSQEKVVFEYEIENNLVKFYSNELNRITGFQLGLEFDQDLKNIHSSILDFNQSNYHMIENSINLAFANGAGIIVAKDEPIFVVELERKTQDVNLSSKLNGEVYSMDLSISNLVLQPKQEEVLLTNYPNPWHEETKISFTAEKSGNGFLIFYDLNGRIEYKLKLSVEQGLNQYSFDRSVFGSTGVKTFKLFLEDQIHLGKMVLIE